MVLTSEQIEQKGLVDNSNTDGQRATTYDATVGSIIEGGCEITTNSYKLAPRGIVWVVSAETFRLPADITGLATLRTTWTHDGILALNVGIVDPGWEGPLAAVLVNFSDHNFVINKGDRFLRILFQEHAPSTLVRVIRSQSEYKKEILNKSKMFSDSFLSMNQLASEVSHKVFSIPKYIIILTYFALLLAFLSVITPLSYSMWIEDRNAKSILSSRILYMEKEIEELKRRTEFGFEMRGM